MKTQAIGRAMAALLACVTSAHAELIAHEPFKVGPDPSAGEYTAGALTGQNPTVAGFVGSWTSSGFNQSGSGNAQVSATGLTFPGLQTSGGAYASSGITCRQPSIDFSDPNLEGTYYMSFLMKYNTIPANAGWKMFEISSPAKNRVAWLGTSQYSHPSDFSFNDQGVIASPNNNSVNLFVLKMQFVAGGNDTFKIWMNPDLGTEPTSGGQTSSGNYAFAYLGIFDSTGNAGITWDEIRIGTTYTDVLPQLVIPQADILTFEFPGFGPATINDTDIWIQVPHGTDPNALAPTFTLSPGATCNPASGASPGFSNPVSYVVTSADDGVNPVTQKTYTVTVKILPQGLFAYEPFTIGNTPSNGEYTAGALTGQNPSTAGFAGAWTSTGFGQWGGGNAQITETGLSYPGLPTSGGSYLSDGITCRQINGVDFTDPNLSGTFYMSFLYQVQGTPASAGWKMLEFSNAQKSRDVWFGCSGYTGDGNNFRAGDPNTLVGPVNNDVNLFVIKMNFVAGGEDTLTIYMNPQLDAEPGSGGVMVRNFRPAYIGIMDTGDATQNIVWDEIRFGTSYADVTGGGAPPEPTPYELWAGASGYNLTGGPEDDDDGDGMSNFQEFAFGLIPISGASSNPITEVGNLLTNSTFSYTRAANSGLTYTVWVSENLNSWNGPVDFYETPGEPANGVETVLVELLDPPTSSKFFVRVRAEEP